MPPAQDPTAPGPGVGSTPALLAGPGRRRLASRDLLGAAQEVEIEHAGSVYRLRQTALGKLILTK